MWFDWVTREELTQREAQYSIVDRDRDKRIRELEQRIAKLEAANNCRDGKHEWVYVPSERNPLGSNPSNCVFTITEPHYACKHCGIKKDEWEKQNKENETDYLLKSPANKKRLYASLEEERTNKTVTYKNLSELKKKFLKQSQPKRKKGRKGKK